MRMTTERKKRLQEIADLHFSGETAREIAKDVDKSIRTIQRDIKYIDDHLDEFLH